MENIRIGTRLLLGFGAVVVLTILLGLYSVDRQRALQALTAEIESRDLGALQILATIEREEDGMRVARQRVLLSAYLRRDRLPAPALDVEQRQWLQARDESQKMLVDLENSAGRWETDAVSPNRTVLWRRIRAEVNNVQQALSALTPEVSRMFQAVNAGDLNTAATRMEEAERLAVDYENRLANVRKSVQEQLDLGRQLAASTAEETRRSVVFVMALAVAAGFVFAFLIHRSITKPLADFSTVMEKVGQGNLCQNLETSRRDEIGDLGRSLERMVSGLRDLAVQTRAGVESLNSATAEILASTQQQAAGTAEQAAAVQEASATMAEISQSGAQISDRAKQVATTAEAASTASVSGMQSVRNMVTTMESIREQAEAVAENVVLLSEKTMAVGEIIQSVNDIAEQSHLLSLNASIQAAVAGEQGRAFSVVASEMKNLAAQSKHATVQVRSILGDIQKGITSSVMLTEEAVKRIEFGRQQSALAENTIRELTASIEESVRAFQQIVGGSSQQQIGFEQVTQAFRNISIASQETATSTKQSEKAAANLSALAQQLRTAVDQYTV
jgi:methyl-accepting chemotaxis protein